MTEVSFAKSFLAAVDSRPTRLTADHVEDPRSYPARPPYILPRSHNPMSRPQPRAAAPGSERSVHVTVRSLLRGQSHQQQQPQLDTDLGHLPVSTSVLEVKTAIVARNSGASLPVERIKLLYRKKPVPDSKVLKDLLSSDTGGSAAIDFSAMVLGGGGADTGAESHTSIAPGSAAKDGSVGMAALKTEEFWADLGGFLQQRLRDKGAADEVLSRFRQSWTEKP
ncbi:hypothetical protein VTK73DRAFT_45 [Phialemonium thermophilum]|uniref:Ubiquitin-like domain-containing protein n=1 Tax=Phialemonium thermophilum TaxID=223376 RepID=A0ABR3Y8S7_9PEZI